MSYQTPPSGPAWEHAPTREAFQRWHHARRVDKAVVHGAGWTVAAGIALFVLAAVIGSWPVGGTGVTVLLLGNWVWVRSVGRDHQALRRTAELAAVLEAWPWAPAPGGLRREHRTELTSPESESSATVHVHTWTLLGPDGRPLAEIDTNEDSRQLREVSDTGAAMWTCTPQGPDALPLAVFVPTVTGGSLYPVRR